MTTIWAEKNREPSLAIFVKPNLFFWPKWWNISTTRWPCCWTTSARRPDCRWDWPCWVTSLCWPSLTQLTSGTGTTSRRWWPFVCRRGARSSTGNVRDMVHVSSPEAVNRGYKVVAECRCTVWSCICCAALTGYTHTTHHYTPINIVQTKNTKKHPSAPFFWSSVGIKRLVNVPSFVSDTSCPRPRDFISWPLTLL